MHCNQEQIEALLDGELTGPEGDAVLAHLRDCPGCRSYYRQLLAMEPIPIPSRRTCLRIS